MARTYEFGAGPIEALYRRQHDGEIGEQLALDEAARLAPHYTPDELVALADDVVRYGYAGRWEVALGLDALVSAVTRADAPRFAAYESRLAALHLRVATTGLYHQPNVTLYREALARGERAFAAETDPQHRGTLAQLLGILHLDPWAANRGNDVQMKEWLRGAVDVVSSRLGEPDGLPTRDDALDLAERWLNAALPPRTGIDRLETLKALVQCRTSRPGFTTGEARDALLALLAEAIPLLEIAPHRTDIRGFLAQVAEAVGAPAAPAETFTVESLQSIDWPARIEAVGREIVSSDILTALRALLARDPSEALAFASTVQGCFGPDAPDADRSRFHELVMTALAGDQVLVPDSLEEVALALGDLPARRAEVMAVITGLISQDREEDAQPLLRALAAHDADLWEHWAETIVYIGATLATGAAVNAFRKRDWRGAQRQYRSAWPAFAALVMPDRLLESLGNLADVVRRGSPDDAEEACREVLDAGVPPLGYRIDDWMRAGMTLADAALDSFQRDGHGTLSAVFTAMRLAKGPTFARQLVHDEQYAWRDDPRARDLVGRIRELAAVTGARREQPGDATLVSYFSSALPTSGVTPEEQRTNLARTFDLTVRTRIAGLVRESAPGLDVDGVRALLDDETVLLDFLQVGPAAGAKACCLALTRDDQAFFVLGTPPLGQRIEIEGGSSTDVLTETSVAVMALREALLADTPAGTVVTPAGASALESLTGRVLGPAAAWLEAQWASGKRRLLMVPSGPLHFAPLHLLGGVDAPLCAQWRVSILPSLELLRVRARATALPGRAVFGIGYEDDALGRRRLSGAVVEAGAIARKLGVNPSLDDSVTPDAVRAALTTCGIVHLACHGSHDAVAPSLQALELMPAADGEAHLTAADLHALDLRGVGLLTLSACETALGRFDVGDNLRGLVAAALGAGAHAVVGTLWPVDDRAAALFFDQLYAGIAAGAPVDVAFHAAQQHTRERLPQVIDWGAFYLCSA